MKTLGERLAYAREKAGYTSARSAALALGVSVSTYNSHERAGEPGARNFDLEAGKAYARKFNVSFAWLMTGEGGPEKSARKADATPAFDPVTDERRDIPLDGIRELDSDAGLGAGQEPDHVYVQGKDGLEVRDAYKPEPWILPRRFMRDGLRAGPEKVIAIATRGDSMEPTIHNGEVVFIDTTNRRVGSGTLHAIRDVYGEIIIKRLDLFRDGDELKVNIISDNRATPMRTEPLSEIAVVGRVCGLFKLL